MGREKGEGEEEWTGRGEGGKGHKEIGKFGR
jgi:hypothetical protein